jgi:hypothetical protein
MPAAPQAPPVKPPDAGTGKLQQMVIVLLVVLIVLAVAILLVLLFKH